MSWFVHRWSYNSSNPCQIWSHLEHFEILTYIANIGIFKRLVEGRNFIGKIWKKFPHTWICTNIVHIPTVDNLFPPLPLSSKESYMGGLRGRCVGKVISVARSVMSNMEVSATLITINQIYFRTQQGVHVRGFSFLVYFNIFSSSPHFSLCISQKVWHNICVFFDKMLENFRNLFLFFLFQFQVIWIFHIAQSCKKTFSLFLCTRPEGGAFVFLGTFHFDVLLSFYCYYR